MINNKLLRIFGIVLALGLGSQVGHAKIRIYTHVDTSAFPLPLKENLSMHPWEKGFLDITKPPYSAKGDGISDDTYAINLAIDHAYACNLVVFFPHGTYLVSDQLQCYQDPGPQLPNNPISSLGQRKFGHILLGSEKDGNWPIILLKDQSTVKDNTLLVFKYYDSLTGKEDASRHYLGSLRNFEIDMGDNPGVSAVYNNGAQHCALENLRISGNFNTGISALPGSGGYTANVEIIGGRIGIQQDQYRPDPTLFGVILKGQSECGLKVLNSRGSVTMAGFQIASPESPSSIYRAIHISNSSTSNELGAMANLNLVDGSIEMHGPYPAIDNYKQDLVIRDVWFKSSILIASGTYTGQPKIVTGVDSVWYRLSEYAYATAVDHGAVHVDLVNQRMAAGDFVMHDALIQQNPPSDLLTRHLWGAMPSWEDVDLVDLVLDYGATPDNDADNDALVIQQAIDDISNPAHVNYGKVLFVPRGHFHIKTPVMIKDGVRMIGAAKNISVIMVADSWIPFTPVSAIITEDKSDQGIILSDLALVRNNANILSGYEKLKHMTLLEMRSGNSIVRDVQTDRRNVKWNDNAYKEPFIVFSGLAGGHVYGLSLDYGTTGPAEEGFRNLLCRDTPNPLVFYQLSMEDASAELEGEHTVHMEISDCRSVSIFGFKYEKESELLHVNRTDSLMIIGGAGNYGIKDPDDRSIIQCRDTRNIFIANISRHIQSGEIAGNYFIDDDDYLVTADAPVVLYTKQWDPALYNLGFLIREKQLGSPVSGAMIQVEGQDIESDSLGGASISSQRGVYTCSVSKPYFKEALISVTLIKDTLIQVNLERQYADVAFNVSGADGMSPESGVTVSIGGLSVVTDSQGTADFEALKVDTLYTFDVSKEGFEHYSGALTIQQDTTIEVQLILTALHELSSSDIIKVRPNPSNGKFRLELHGILTDEVTISIYNMNARIVDVRSGLVKENGTIDFELENQDPGIYHLSITGKGLPPGHTRIMIL